MMRVVKHTAMDPDAFQLDTGFLAFIGGGVKYRATGAWGVRADARFMVFVHRHFARHRPVECHPRSSMGANHMWLQKR